MFLNKRCAISMDFRGKRIEGAPCSPLRRTRDRAPKNQTHLSTATKLNSDPNFEGNFDERRSIKKLKHALTKINEADHYFLTLKNNISFYCNYFLNIIFEEHDILSQKSKIIFRRVVEILLF